MIDGVVPPFSARNRGAHAQVDNDFPETGRIALVHVVDQLLSKRYVEDWHDVNRELERLARIEPGSNYTRKELLLMLSWDRVFDFCERLYSHLAQDVVRYDDRAEEMVVVTTKIEAQKYISAELELIFAEEHLAFEFSNGLVQRRGRRNTHAQIARAELVLGDARLSKARGHFNKALKFFRSVQQPDYENVCKEAVCAIEATANAVFPSGGATLDDIVKSITGGDVGQLPAPIAKTFLGLYGFRNGGTGVTHGTATGGVATKEIAEYVLAAAASQIVLLSDLNALSEADIPF